MDIAPTPNISTAPSARALQPASASEITAVGSVPDSQVLINSCEREIEANPQVVLSAIMRGAPKLGETREELWDQVQTGICTKEPLGDIACRCHIEEEFQSYAGIHDMAFGGTSKYTINELLVGSKFIGNLPMRTSGTLVLRFCPCRVCQGTILQIEHEITIMSLTRTMYRRSEMVRINNMQYFVDRKKSPAEVHQADLKMKVEALAKELEHQWSICDLQPQSP